MRGFDAILAMGPEHARVFADAGWDRERIDGVVDSEKRTVVRFKAPIDIMLFDWTASPDPESGIQFHPDVYNRDPKSLELLLQEPRWAPI